jgi:hypothetical protein
MNIIEQHFLDLKHIDKLSLLINSRWIGKAYPENTNLNIRLNCKFEQIDNKIIGFMDVDDEGEILIIKLEGGIVQLPFLIFDYFSTNPLITNYGRIMYEINDNWTELNGRVVGFSGERNLLVIAKHELTIEI